MWLTLKRFVRTRGQNVTGNRAADQHPRTGDMTRLLDAIAASPDKVFVVGLVFKSGVNKARHERPGWIPEDARVSKHPVPRLYKLLFRSAAGEALAVVTHGWPTAAIEQLQAFRTLRFPGIERHKPHWFSVKLDYQWVSRRFGSGLRVQLLFSDLHVLSTPRG